ncbi:phage tail spike protein [Bacillus cereus]|uniref:phage tail spike protein n=2 Tax=Bacillus cereus TaxID=1396 RepID=UPI0035566CD5
MRTPSGELHICDFQTDEIISVLQPENYWEDNRHWELKNNVDILEFKVFDGTEQAIALQQQNLIIKEVRNGRMVPYVINNEAEKDSKDRSLKISASGAWVQIAQEGFIKPQRIESETVDKMMDIALLGMKWKRGKTEYSGFHTLTIEEFINPLECLKKIAALFDLEIEYRVEIVGSQIVGWYVDMIKRRGDDSGKEIELAKDLVGIKRIEHSRNICTALIGFVHGEGDSIITVESINKGLPYIIDEAAFQRWNSKGNHKFGFYSPETEREDMTPERLMTLMKIEMKKRINTFVSYEVEAQSIGRIYGLEHEQVNEGDTVHIKDEGFTPKLYLEARVIAGDESFKDPSKDKYVFGDYREIIDPNEESRKLYNKLRAWLDGKANNELVKQLDELAKQAKKESEQAVKDSKSAKDISEKLKENIETNMVNIIEGKEPPTTDLKPNKTLWRDISNGKPGILKIWTGTAWESVVPDVEKIKKDTIEQVNKDIQLTKEELNKKVEKAQEETTGQYNKVTENLKEVTRTISNVQNSQGEIDKKITRMQQTDEVFTKSIESLTKNDATIVNKLNTVEDTVEGTKQSISAVQQTTNDLTKTTNEIRNTATSNKQSIEQLQTDISNISVGSINLASSSETGLNKQNMTGTWSEGKQMTLSDKINYRNKTFTISFLFTGKMTKINANPWFGVETAITYADGEQEWKSVRVDSPLKINVDYKDEPLSVTFKTKDKDITLIRFYYSGRNIDGNLNSHHAKFEEGNIRTTWQLSNDEVTSKADFTKKTNDINQTLEENTQTISKIQKEQGTMQSTLNRVEQTSTSNSQTITALTEKQTEHGKLIQENKNEIIQTKDSLSSKISEKQMQAYVGALGSTNQFFNTEFKKKTVDANGNVTNEIASTDKWTIAGVVSGATVTPVTDRRHDGYNSVRIANAGVAANSWTGIAQSIGASQNSGDYVLSTWVYVGDKNLLDQGACVKLQFFNGSNALGFAQTEIKDLLINGSWVLVSVTIKAPDVPVTRLQGDIWVRRNGTMWVSQPQLQQGKEPSVYMPNPKDITNYKELVDLVADKIAKSDFDTVTKKMQTSIDQNTEEIGFRAKATEVYSKTDADKKFAYVLEMEAAFSLTNQNINSRVKKGDVISQINQSAEQIQIQASRINLIGYVTAEHIKGKVLEGVTLKTSGNRFVEINKQNMKIFDADTPRGYIGFMETNDGSIQPSLVLGSDNIKYRGTGSFYIYQVMPRINGVDQPSKAYARFGISKGENAEGTNIWSNYIQMHNDGGHMSVYSDGQLRFQNLNNIIFESEGWAPGYGYFSVTTTEPHIFTNNAGQFTFKRKGSDYKIHFVNGATDHDLIMGNAMIRSSFVQGYNNGLQIKDMMGQGWKDIELRTLRAKENISATGRMWAQEFIPNSSRTLKTDIEDLPFSALDKINSVNIKQYHFIRDVERFESGESIILPINYGMIAEDSDDVFTTPQKDAVTLYSTVSISIQAIQEVDFKVKNLQFDHGMWKQEVDNLKEQLEAEKLEKVSMKAEIDELKVLVQQLINEKPEQP